MNSWVETTCPPGWAVEYDGAWYAYQLHPEAGAATGHGGVIAWRYSQAAANRLAWERWALEMLGGRVVWGHDGDGRPMLWWDRMDVGLMTVEWGERHGYVGHNDCNYYEDTHCHDPVEALARFAGLVLAVAGPPGAHTTGASAPEGGEP